MNSCILGTKTVFPLSACPKTIADVGLHVAVARSLRNSCSLERWDDAGPLRCSHISAAIAWLPAISSELRAGETPLGPGGLPDPQPCAAALLGAVVMLPPQLEPLRPPRTPLDTAPAPGRAPCPSLTAALGRAALGLILG